MGLVDRVKMAYRVLSRDNLPSGMFPSGSVVDHGITANYQTIISIPSVSKGLQIISEAVAGCDVGLYRFNEQTQMQEPVMQHKLYDLLKYGPNDYQSTYDFFLQGAYHYKIYGNTYILKETNLNSGELVALHNLLPDRVTIDVVRDDEGKPVLRYRYKDATYLQHEIIQIRGISRGGLKGLDILERFADTWALNKKANVYGINAFKSNVPNAILSYKKDAGDTVVKQAMSRYNEMVEGKTGLLVLTGENEIMFPTVAPENMQFLQTRLFNVGDVARVLNIPATLLGDNTHDTYNNRTDEKLDFANQTIEPILRQYVSAFKKGLLNEENDKDLFIAFDASYITRGGELDRYKVYAIALTQGIQTVDEIRMKEGLGPLLEDDDDEDEDEADSQDDDVDTDTEDENEDDEESDTNNEGDTIE